jgi:hypothetical protein
MPRVLSESSQVIIHSLFFSRSQKVSFSHKFFDQSNQVMRAEMEGYTCSAPVDCEKQVDVSKLKGKTAIITGGKYCDLPARKKPS